MIGALGVIGTFAAVALAQASIHVRNSTETLETLAGLMLVGGLGSLGAALPHFC